MLTFLRIGPQSIPLNQVLTILNKKKNIELNICEVAVANRYVTQLMLRLNLA